MAWLFDWLLINVAAIIVGVGAALVVAIFPIAKNPQPLFQAIAGAAYVLWAAAYFVAFWSTTGQTPGARLMQVRFVTASGKPLRPGRALVRWAGMYTGLLPLPLGYVLVPFKRRAFPDWLAKTLVLDTPQLSLAGGQIARIRAARDEPTADSDTTPRDAGRSRIGRIKRRPHS